jgi:hypothetical protein
VVANNVIVDIMATQTLVYILTLMMLIFAVPSLAEEQSVSLGGHTFTSTLPDGWVLSSDSDKIKSFDSSNTEDSLFGPDATEVTGIWRGKYVDAFDYLAYPNAPKDNSKYGMATGSVYAYVLTIPDQVKKSLEEQDIALYGSLDKVPEDQKAKDMQEMFRYAAYVTKNGFYEYYSDKEITFNDRPARLWESDDQADLVVSLDPNTVAVLQVFAASDLPSEEDAAIFSGEPWDMLETITIT